MIVLWFGREMVVRRRWDPSVLQNPGEWKWPIFNLRIGRI